MVLIYGFTGRQFEPESGLYYYRNRAYDPYSGRFMTKDPKGISAGDVNLNRYVNNKPYEGADPFGLESDLGGYAIFDLTEPGRTLPSAGTIQMANDFATHLYRNLIVTSAGRTPEVNTSVGGKPSSRHLTTGANDAIDVRVRNTGMTEQELANEAKDFGYGGIFGGYSGGHLHLDRRPNPASNICK